MWVFECFGAGYGVGQNRATERSRAGAYPSKREICPACTRQIHRNSEAVSTRRNIASVFYLFLIGSYFNGLLLASITQLQPQKQRLNGAGVLFRIFVENQLPDEVQIPVLGNGNGQGRIHKQSM